MSNGLVLVQFRVTRRAITEARRATLYDHVMSFTDADDENLASLDMTQERGAQLRDPRRLQGGTCRR